MTPERWQHIDAIFQAAVELNPGQRAAFLRTSCGDDEELRSEVESLITADEEGFSLIEAPAFEIAAGMLADDGLELAEGEHLGNYEILVLLGVGGMGEVYLAEDANLGRKIALKFLPVEFTHDKERLRRFRQEARAASALNHPNILTIHEISQVENRYYIATEFVDGETLRQRLICSMLTLHEALDIAVQVASALAAAHQAGIIHRDIKPENIMVRRDGIVKVLDFGLVKLAEQQGGDFTESPEAVKNSLAELGKRHGVNSEAPTLIDTRGGTVMGTVHYMSPEQALGLEVDERTDVWSFGVVLHEVLAGRTPYEGKTVGEIISSIQRGEPPQLNNCALEARAELGPIVRKCLETDREHRYQSAQDLLDDLRNLKREVESGAVRKAGGELEPTSEPKALLTRGEKEKGVDRSRRLTLGAVGVLLVGLTLALVHPWSSRNSQGPKTVATVRSLAVLPFKPVSASDEDEYLRLGMADALITKLSNIREINVRPTSAVRKYDAPNQDPVAAGRELRVEAVVEGSVLRVGEQVRVTIQLVSVRDGAPLWAEKFDEKFTNILAVQDRISEQVARALTLTLSSAEKELLTKHYTENSEAYQLYLKGRYFWNKRTVEGLKKGIGYFNEAVEKDPSYALAYVGLADSYSLLSDYEGLPPNQAYPQAKKAAMQALELDERLAEAHAALAFIKAAYDWDWPGAEREYRRAIELNPNYETAHQWYAEYLSGMGRHPEAIAEIRRAKEINPISLIINAVEAWVLYYAREYDQAIVQGQKVVEMDPQFAEVYEYLKRCYDQKGMYREAIAARQMRRKFAGYDAKETAALREAAAATSAGVYWQKRLEQDVEESRREPSTPFEMGEIFAQLGKKDQAFAWLDRAYEERSFFMMYLKVAPNLDPLRSDPRFADLLRRVGLS